MDHRDEETPPAAMTPERWRRAFRLLDEVIDRPPAERREILERACADDPALRREVEELARSYDGAGTFIDRPAAWIDTRIEDAAAPDPGGSHIGGYRVLRTLGRGGMGEVFLAERADGTYQQRVAVKVLQGGMASDELVHRFRSERQILANLEHPAIAKLLDGGTTADGRPFLVMEYVDGTPIDRYCDERQLPTSARLELFIKVCRAVHYAHQNLVVHRDVKPRNILIDPSGEPKLLDFGIAKLLAPESFPQTVLPTRPGLMPMTPEYASPEQVSGGVITTASDVYSLGVLLYELLTGRRPYRLTSRDPQEVARVICEQPPEKPSTAAAWPRSAVEADSTTLAAGVPEPRPAETRERRRQQRRLAGDLDTIVLMALRKEPQRRYGSAEQLARDVERHLAGLPVRARSDTLLYRLGKFVGRHKLGVAAAAAVLAMMVGFLLTLLVQRSRILDERNRAERVSEFLVEMFAGPDPSRARGETVRARDLLDKGAREIDRELRGQPQVRAALMETMGRSYRNLGMLEESEPLLVESLALRRDLYPAGHPDVAANARALAQLKASQGDFEASAALHREALEMRRRLLGNDSEEVAQSLLQLARVLELAGGYDEAEPLLREALDISRRLAAEETLATALDRLGSLLVQRVRYDEAEAAYREALAIYRRLADGPHLETSVSLNNLAGVLDVTGDYEQAAALYRQAEEMQRRLFEGPHPYLASTINNLADLAHRRGLYDEAGELFPQALEMNRELYAGDHPKVAETLHGFASLLWDQGEDQRAEELFTEALDQRRATLGDDHPDTAVSLGALATVLAGRDELDRAEALFRQALEIHLESLGEDHPQVGVTLNDLADVAVYRGDYEQAEKLYRRALALFRRALGPDSSEAAILQYNLGALYEDLGRLEEAETLYLEALDAARRTLGERHTQVATVLIRFAWMKIDQGEHEEAEGMARQALDIYAAALPAGHSYTSGAQRVLGVALFELGRYAEAAPLLVARYEWLRDNDGAEAESTSAALARVVALYEAWGKPAEAAEYRALGRR